MGEQDQLALRTRLASVLSLVSSHPQFNVSNVITFSAGSSPVYSAELDSTEAVASLLRAFMRFTRRRDPVSRPADLEKVGLYHSVTIGTRVRISLLRVML